MFDLDNARAEVIVILDFEVSPIKMQWNCAYAKFVSNMFISVHLSHEDYVQTLLK